MVRVDDRPPRYLGDAFAQPQPGHRTPTPEEHTRTPVQPFSPLPQPAPAPTSAASYQPHPTSTTHPPPQSLMGPGARPNRTRSDFRSSMPTFNTQNTNAGDMKLHDLSLSREHGLDHLLSKSGSFASGRPASSVGTDPDAPITPTGLHARFGFTTGSGYWEPAELAGTRKT